MHRENKVNDGAPTKAPDAFQAVLAKLKTSAEVIHWLFKPKPAAHTLWAAAATAEVTITEGDLPNLQRRLSSKYDLTKPNSCSEFCIVANFYQLYCQNGDTAIEERKLNVFWARYRDGEAVAEYVVNVIVRTALGKALGCNPRWAGNDLLFDWCVDKCCDGDAEKHQMRMTSPHAPVKAEAQEDDDDEKDKDDDTTANTADDGTARG